MSLYHFYEERRGCYCCDRLHERDGRICPSWLSVAAYTVCANELASSHGQSSPFALLKITFTSFAQLIQAHKKWELHRRCPLLLLLLWGLCRHGRQSEDPNAACSSCPLYCLPLPYISIWKVSQVLNSCLAKKSQVLLTPPPPHPPTPIHRPHSRSLWPSVGNNKPKPFKQSFRQQGRESYEAKIQRFTSHGVATLASVCLCSALPEVKRREREGQCNWPHNAKSPCSSERESFMNSNCITLIPCF